MNETRPKYTKPVLVDLQDSTPQASALCNNGTSDLGNCWPNGNKAGSGCVVGPSAKLACVSGSNAATWCSNGPST